MSISHISYTYPVEDRVELQVCKRMQNFALSYTFPTCINPNFRPVGGRVHVLNASNQCKYQDSLTAIGYSLSWTA